MHRSKKIYCFFVAMTCLVFLVSLVAFQKSQESLIQSRKERLDDRVQVIDRLFSHWFDKQMQTLNTWSRYPEILYGAQELARLPAKPAQLTSSPVQSELRQFFSPLLKTSQIDSFMLVDKKGTVLSASDNRLLGRRSPVAGHATLFAPLWLGSNRWLMPYDSPLPALDHDGVFRPQQPMLLIAAPISDGLKNHFALIFTVNLERELYGLYRTVATGDDHFLQVTSSSRSLVHIGRHLLSEQQGLHSQRQLISYFENPRWPVSYSLGAPFPSSLSTLTVEQTFFLGIGSCSLLALVTLLIGLGRMRFSGQKERLFSQHLFEQGYEGVVLVADDGKVQSFNRRAAQMLAGDEAVTPELMTTLIQECCLGLRDESGQLLGSLESLIRGGDDFKCYAHWSVASVNRQLSFVRMAKHSDHTVVSIEDVTRSRQELLYLKRHSDALNDAGEVVVWANADGQIVSSNETAVLKLGYSQQELLRLVVSDFDASLTEESWRLIWSRIRKGGVVEQEASLIRRNGHVLPVEMMIRFYTDGSGDFACLFARDITKRKRLESDLYRKRAQLTEKLSVTSQELEVREAENEAFIEALPDLLVIFNSRLEVQSFQYPQGGRDSLNLSVGQGVKDIFPSQDLGHLWEQLAEQSFDGLARYFTEITLEQKGYIQYLELRFTQTGTNKIMLLVRDITERKRNEYFRNFNNRLLTSISEMQTRFISAQDKKPQIEEQIRALAGLVASESGFCWVAEGLQRNLNCGNFVRVDLQPVAETVADDLVYRQMQSLAVRWQSHTDQATASLVPVKDFTSQTLVDVHKGLLILPVFHSGKLSICFGLFLQDYRHWVSETGLFDPWLSTVSAILAAYDTECERVRAEMNLKLEKDRAEYASQVKTQFLSRMSHEFRTPLNAILGFSQLLQMEPEITSEQREHIDQVVDSGQEMLALVDDVLDLAQMERREFNLNLARSSLTRIVTQCVAELIADIEEADLRFEADIPKEDVFVWVDEKRLSQAIHSLLRNAIAYTETGGQIWLRQRCLGAFCELTVQDTGKGIPHEFIDKLFMPFEVADDYINAEGMGNGLAIAHYAMEAMGGTILVDSDVGVGSIFTLRIPCDQLISEVANDSPASCDCDEKESLPIQSSSDGFLPVITDVEEVPAVGRHKAYRVLYVEDDEANLKLLERFLSHYDEDISFIPAESVEQGLAVLKKQTPDLIFVDMNLGRQSGIAILDAVRKCPTGEELPVIAVSGDVAPDKIDQALSQGFDDYLCKPVSLESLTHVLQRYAG